VCTQIKRVAEFRVKNWALIGDLEPKTEQQRMLSNVVNVIPERDQEGRRVLIVNCGGKQKYDFLHPRDATERKHKRNFLSAFP
jgi:hypothetical protein